MEQSLSRYLNYKKKARRTEEKKSLLVNKQLELRLVLSEIKVVVFYIYIRKKLVGNFNINMMVYVE